MSEGRTVEIKEDFQEYQVPIKRFKEAPYNPRKIGDEELKRLQNSIWHHTESFSGWYRAMGYRLAEPILINKLNFRIISGHKRCEALINLGQDWIHKDDIKYLSIPDEKKEAALNIALNNREMQGDFDMIKLKDLIVEIDTGEFNIEEFTGFNYEDMKEMFDYESQPENSCSVDDNNKTPKTIRCPHCGEEFNASEKFTTSQQTVS